jgi:glycosyltransferase involved in cell wall biosynthesis
VLTPSFNQARFLEQNLASVRGQGEVVLEHIVADGGSTDGSRELLERSGVRFVSEKDRGQADALNKALAMSSGEIIGWINSDDLYLPGAAARAVALLDAHPELDMVYGHSNVIDADGHVVGRVDAYPTDLEGLLVRETIPQPSAFVRRDALTRVGGVDAGYRYAMDYDLWLRLALQGSRWRAFDEVWAQFRVHGDSKTVSQPSRFRPEVRRAMQRALASDRLPPALRGRSRELRRRFHTSVGLAYYNALDLASARAELARAVAADPIGVDWALLRYALKSLLPKPVIEAARTVKLRR